MFVSEFQPFSRQLAKNKFYTYGNLCILDGNTLKDNIQVVVFWSDFEIVSASHSKKAFCDSLFDLKFHFSKTFHFLRLTTLFSEIKNYIF